MKGFNPLNAIEVNTDPGEEYQTSNRQFQGIPGIEVAKNSRLWATWYSGGTGEGANNYVLLVTSADDGTTWSEPVLVCDPPGTVRAYDPVIWHDPLDRLWLFWSQCEGKSGTFDGVAGVWGIYTENSDDEQPTWSKPIRIANGIMMNKPTVLSNGDWAYPTALWVNRAGGEVVGDLKKEQFSNITISPDQGKTYYCRGGADVPDRTCDEHMFIERQNGPLWVLVRTQYGIGQSFSDDWGKTWIPGENSGIYGPNSRFFIRRLQSGKLLLVNHQKPDKDQHVRCKMTAWLSDDDGISWYGQLMLDKREVITYPDGIQDKDGNIYIIYDRERTKEGEILFAKFREEDVIAGKTISPICRLKQVINRTGGNNEYR